MHLVQQVFDLALRWPHFDNRIQQPGRANDLLHHLLGLFELIFARRRADVDGLLHDFGELIELQRAVVQRAGQPETVLDQHFFARAVPGVHAPNLWESSCGSRR